MVNGGVELDALVVGAAEDGASGGDEGCSDLSRGWLARYMCSVCGYASGSLIMLKIDGLWLIFCDFLCDFSCVFFWGQLLLNSCLTLCWYLRSIPSALNVKENIKETYRNSPLFIGFLGFLVGNG